MAGSDWRKSMHEASPYLGLGMQLALAMVFFSIGGYLLDLRLNTLPWLTIVGGLLGMTAVFVQLIRVAGQMGKKTGKKAPPDDSNNPGS